MSEEGCRSHREDLLIEAPGSDNSSPEKPMATWVLSLKYVGC